MTENQEVRLRCFELAMKTSIASEFLFKASDIADDIYEWVMRTKPEESKPGKS